MEEGMIGSEFPRRIYFDHCILNDIYTLLLWDNGVPDPRYRETTEYDRHRELIALRYLLDLDQEWNLEFGTSEVTKVEAERTQNPVKKSELLRTLALLNIKTVRSSAQPSLFHVNDLEDAIRHLAEEANVKVDREDIRHLREAKLGGWDVFLTLDQEIIKIAGRLLNLGIKVRTPLELLEEYLDLPLLIRTLNGSWTSISQINLKPLSQTEAYTMTTVRMTELRYDPRVIEKKWQERWERDGIYRVRDDDPRPKWYELTMYPYPSGDLHIGHWYAMAPSDAHARFRRMQGYNVLHPMGFDSFGLPAENAAIKRGIHPYVWTMRNIENMRRQLRSMGTIYDWDREIVCCEPRYYRWNQWFFLKLYHAGLAYRAKAPANWCPSCQTTLANEQVVEGGKCERCSTIVSRRDLEQWFLRITRYADELLDHSRIQWPERVKSMQTNWIGHSEGVEVGFDISHYGLPEKELRTFTTRIDTIFGVTFVVMAPEHPLVERLTTPKHGDEMRAYVEQARRQTEVERLSAEKEKTGVFTGAYCINRLNGERIPILVADYVLLTYGTGVVMGVPAHDQRDFEFARRYGLPIRVVVAPSGWHGEELSQAYLAEGVQVNSGPFNGISNKEGMERIADHIEAKGWGKRTVSYRMRDWLISRQRYWGTPIPIIYCDQCGTVPVPEEALPVLLPEDAQFRPTGESPLKYHQGFVNTICPRCGKAARRETDTMDTFVDSSWYFVRYLSSRDEGRPFDPALARKWLPVDQYTGGAEHAVMHLLYARFFVKALRDLGIVEFDEPFIRLFNQGHIIAQRHKMSKSRGNVITPDPYVEEVGADVVRCYLMFLGPWDQGGEWSDQAMNGVARWLNRVWELADSPDISGSGLAGRPRDEAAIRDLKRAIHKTIRRVVEDVEEFKFNTAIAALMEYTNALSQAREKGGVDPHTWREAIEKLLLLLAPIAPHVTEELWEKTGHPYSIHNQRLPQWDPALAADEVITLVVQVNGKVRDRLEVPASISEEEAKRLALESQKVRAHIGSGRVAQTIYVPGRLVNVVVK